MMKSPSRLSTVFRLIVAGLLACAATAPSVAGSCLLDTDDRVPDQLVVELNMGASIDALIARFAGTYDLRILDSIPSLRLWLLEADGLANVDPVLADLALDLDVAGAEPHLRAESPESSQRSLPILDTGFTADAYRQQPAATSVGAPTAQAVLTGRGVRVAVIDTSFALGHSELRGRIDLPGLDLLDGSGTAGLRSDGVDNDVDGQIDEAFNHGSHVAGLIQLIAPDARILPIRAIDEEGRGPAFTVAKAIQAAADMGADVINLSLALRFQSNLLGEVIDDVVDDGVIVVVAAGNRGEQCVEYPAADENTIAVAALDEADLRAGFSNFGPEVTISAPGTDLLSTHNADDINVWDGTSFASPIVAGAVALLLEKYPGLSSEDVERFLRDTALPDANGPELNGLMGAGVLNAAGLIEVRSADTTSLRFFREAGSAPVLRFSPIEGATAYDVIRGDVANLAMPAATVQLGAVTCLADDVALGAGDFFVDLSLGGADPSPGDAWFYLFRHNEPEQGGDYGDDTMRLPASGDCTE